MHIRIGEIKEPMNSLLCLLLIIIICLLFSSPTTTNAKLECGVPCDIDVDVFDPNATIYVNDTTTNITCQEYLDTMTDFATIACTESLQDMTNTNDQQITNNAMFNCYQ
jgi:hypothetical protein